MNSIKLIHISNLSMNTIPLRSELLLSPIGGDKNVYIFEFLTSNKVLFANFYKNRATLTFDPQIGSFYPHFNPQTPPGPHPRVIPGQRLGEFYRYQLVTAFQQVLSKSKVPIFCNRQKSAIFGHFGPFWGYFTPFLPPRGRTRVIPKKSFSYISTYIMINLCAKFQKNLRYGF